MLFPNDDRNGGPPPFEGGARQQQPLEDEGFDGGMYYVDFGPFFGQELAKVLRYKQSGLMTEIVFWQGGYGY